MARQILDRAVKFKRLVSELGMPRPYVRGLLETLWDVAHECGCPVIGDASDVEAAAEWPGEQGKFFEAMKLLGWIDPTPGGEWEIHDYWDHAPEYVKKRLVREMERKNRGNGLKDSADNGRQRQTTAENGPTPTPTPTHIKKTTSSSSSDDDAALVEWVIEFWKTNKLQPSVRGITKQRRSSILARKREHSEAGVKDALRKRADSNFLNNVIFDGRGAPIDWVFGPKNFIKVLDGNFDNKTGGRGNGRDHSAYDGKL